MKKWLSQIIVYTLFFLLYLTPLVGQNALTTLGLTSATPAASSYSLRKMSSTYSGPLARITIGTNYYDVYPDTTSGLFALTSKISAVMTTYNAAVAAASANALSTIITAGVTTAKVAIWYDQSGNANNVIQATTANQPRVINLGTIETLNGMPTLRFDKTSANFMESVNSVNIAGASSVNAVSSSISSSANTASIVTTKAVTAKDGLTAATASTSAYQIKQDFPSATDGLYWIQNANINGGVAFKIYADMTTDGGGWTLILCNAGYSVWTYSNTISYNTGSPSVSANYSIISWANYIKKSTTGFQYMLDADTRGSYGGIWTVNNNISFTSSSNTSTIASGAITRNFKFGTWPEDDNGTNLAPRMPYYASSGNSFLTTDADNTGNWWGTLVTAASNWGTAPWMNTGGIQNPTYIWYWVR